MDIRWTDYNRCLESNKIKESVQVYTCNLKTAPDKTTAHVSDTLRAVYTRIATANQIVPFCIFLTIGQSQLRHPFWKICTKCTGLVHICHATLGKIIKKTKYGHYYCRDVQSSIKVKPQKCAIFQLTANNFRKRGIRWRPPLFLLRANYNPVAEANDQQNR